MRGRLAMILLIVALPLALSVGAVVGFLVAAAQAGAPGWVAGGIAAALAAGSMVALDQWRGRVRVPMWAVGLGSAVGVSLLSFGFSDTARAAAFAFAAVYLACVGIVVAVRLRSGASAPFL